MSTKKKKIPEMMPTKKWLSTNEACAYLDVSVNIFNELSIRSNLTIAAIGKKKYYRVDQIEKLIEKNILINHD